VQRGHLARNVADLAEPPTSKQVRSKVARERVWNGEQLRAFLDAAKPDLLHPLFFLVATTGLRRGEVCALDLTDVDMETATVTVSEAKSEGGGAQDRAGRRDRRRAARWLVRREELRRAAGPAWAGSKRLFTDEIGRPVKPDRVYRRLLAIADCAELPRLNVHGLASQLCDRRAARRRACARRVCASGPRRPVASRCRCMPTCSKATTTPRPSSPRLAILGADGDSKPCTC
jgi:integrase